MATWLEDVVEAYEYFNGRAHYSKIYEYIKNSRNFLPKSYESIIRSTVESHSSDSTSYKGIQDLFYFDKDKGPGSWGLRQLRNVTPVATDLEINILKRNNSVKSFLAYRILIETESSLQLKKLYDNQCQFCSQKIYLSDGSGYSEAHHIIPLNKKHNGTDNIDNIIILCPNHHVMLDYGVLEINIDKLRFRKGHSISAESIKYHNTKIFKDGPWCYKNRSK